MFIELKLIQDDQPVFVNVNEIIYFYEIFYNEKDKSLFLCFNNHPLYLKHESIKLLMNSFSYLFTEITDLKSNKGKAYINKSHINYIRPTRDEDNDSFTIITNYDKNRFSSKIIYEHTPLTISKEDFEKLIK